MWRALCEVRLEVTSLDFGNTVAIPPHVHKIMLIIIIIWLLAYGDSGGDT
jgi:hypothetical protein